VWGMPQSKFDHHQENVIDLPPLDVEEADIL
jgi:hypothetical protein